MIDYVSLRPETITRDYHRYDVICVREFGPAAQNRSGLGLIG